MLCHAIWPVLKERSVAWGAAFVDHADLILPTLAMYIAQGPLSLRVWTAVQQLPPYVIPAKAADATNEKKAWYYRMMKSPTLYFLALYALCFGVAQLLRSDNGIVYNLYASFLCTTFSPVMIVHTFLALGLRTPVIVRNALGLPVFCGLRRKDVSSAVMALGIAGGTLIAFLGLIYNISVCKITLYLALLHSFAQTRSQQVQSIRKLILLATALYALTVITTVIITVIAMHYKTNNDVSEDGSESSPIPGITVAYLNLVQWWNALVWAALPQAIIAICYRFDYANGASITLPSEAESLQAVTTKLGAGVHLPGRLSKSFSKPYYLTTIAAWCFANGGLLYTISMGYIKFRDNDPAYGMFAALFACPFMVFSILLVAALKGQLKAMWTFEEKWGMAPVKLDAAQMSAVRPLLYALIDEKALDEE